MTQTLLYPCMSGKTTPTDQPGLGLDMGWLVIFDRRPTCKKNEYQAEASLGAAPERTPPDRLPG